MFDKMPSFYDFKNEILNLIFPNVCGICSEISEKNICENCYNQVLKVKTFRIDNWKRNKV